MFQIHVIKLLITIVLLSYYILEKHRYWHWNQILDCIRRGYAKIPQTYEFGLLSIEINVGSDAVGVCVKDKKYLVVVSVNYPIIS